MNGRAEGGGGDREEHGRGGRRPEHAEARGGLPDEGTCDDERRDAPRGRGRGGASPPGPVGEDEPGQRIRETQRHPRGARERARVGQSAHEERAGQDEKAAAREGDDRGDRRLRRRGGHAGMAGGRTGAAT